MTWTETGGPRVAEPRSSGFGTTLIRQAVPYEMGGTSELAFEPDGVRAHLYLPEETLAPDAPDSLGELQDTPLTRDQTHANGETALRNGLILILEDNFMIAEGMRVELQDAGFVNVETLGTTENAMSFLKRATPVLALLDVNLGHGRTSEPVASALLQRDVPVIFVTGYGEQNNLPAHLRAVPVVTKPVIRRDLLTAIEAISI